MAKAVNIPLTRKGSQSWGCHRVLAPKACLPQAAEVLDASLPIYSDESLIAVEYLHLDSASMHQLNQAHHGDKRGVAAAIADIVAARGKMHNPVTGSGGMLSGQISQVGPESQAAWKVGDRIATLVSLTWTPLSLSEIKQVNLNNGVVQVSGHAILFDHALAAVLPPDLPEAVVLSALDVCGAPAWVKRLAQPSDRILILGTGKAGMLSLAAALDVVPAEQVVTVDLHERTRKNWPQSWEGVRSYAHDVSAAVSTWTSLEAAGEGPFDLVVHTCNTPETETLPLLAAKAGGKVLYFNMATNFSRTVLSAEGLGKDLQLIMGNGYVPGHAEYALNLLRRHGELTETFGKGADPLSGRKT